LVDFSSSKYMNAPASGAFSVLLTGAGISTSARTKLGATAAPSTFWLSHSAVLSRMGSLINTNDINQVVLTCNRRVSVSYSKRNLIFHHVLIGARGTPLTDSCQLKLQGRSFGLGISSLAINFGKTCSEASSWLSDSSILVKTSQSCKSCAKEIVLTVLTEINSLPFSFDPTTATTSLLGICASTGSNSLRIEGSDFSKFDTSTIFRLENTGMVATKWISHSSSWCKSPAVKRFEQLSVFITTNLAANVSSNLQERLAIQQFTLTALVRTGSTKVDVIASTIDCSSRLRFGYSSLESTVWMSGTSVSAKFGTSALNKILRVALSSDGKTALAGYNGPQTALGTLTVIQFESSSPRATTSSQVIVAYGGGLLLSDNSCKHKIGNTASESSNWKSDSAMSGKTYSGHWYMVDGAVSYMSQSAEFRWSSTSREQKFHWSLEIAASCLPTSGTVNIRLLGAGLGNHDVSLRSRLELTSITSSTWNSDSSISTKLSAGVGRVYAVAVSLEQNVHQQHVNMSEINFRFPEISSITALDNRTLIVQGASMGVLEPRMIASYFSINRLQGSVSTEIAVLNISKFSQNGRVIDFEMTLSLENFTRIDGLTVSLLSPAGITFPLLKNKCKGCYQRKMHFQFSDRAASPIPNAKCVDGRFRFDHFPVLRELLLGSHGDWKVVAAAGTERDFATIYIRIDVYGQDYLSLIDTTEKAVFEMWSSDSGLTMIRGPSNARNSVPNVIISSQLGRNQAPPISAVYEPEVASVNCFIFPETGSGMITITGKNLAQSVFVGEKSWDKFDRASLSAAIKTGETSCESSPWRSQSSILCKTTGRPILTDHIQMAVTIERAVATALLDLPELGVAY